MAIKTASNFLRLHLYWDYCFPALRHWHLGMYIKLSWHRFKRFEALTNVKWNRASVMWVLWLSMHLCLIRSNIVVFHICHLVILLLAKPSTLRLRSPSYCRNSSSLAIQRYRLNSLTKLLLGSRCVIKSFSEHFVICIFKLILPPCIHWLLSNELRKLRESFLCRKSCFWEIARRGDLTNCAQFHRLHRFCFLQLSSFQSWMQGLMFGYKALIIWTQVIILIRFVLRK